MTPVSDGRAEAIVLAGLPGMGPRRLAALLDALDPAEALARVAAGRVLDVVALDGAPLLAGMTSADASALVTQWRVRVRGVDPPALLRAHTAAGVQVLLRADPTYPSSLLHDIEAPAVVFALGHLEHLDRPSAAVVGTRRCTGVGAGFARELGRDLTQAGVAVVSGLALGIDGAAHRGALDARGEGEARPVGVVGSGLDVVYPPRHRELWHAVGADGVLLSEAPLGVRPAPWRFPARNRMLAALADAVVVVESHAVGGALHTVTEAARRDVPVLAVPGSVRSPAAAGTNALLADGCQPARDVTDVLVALGLSTSRRGQRRSPTEAPAEAPAGDAATVLEAFGWEPATLEHLAAQSGLGLDALTITLEELVGRGAVELHGGWYERVGERPC